ncbi:hypothetical protein AVEN_14568-1 [Araneus ventricosus]|uniref:Uncharacterized protein n=1 Tax=Araneus ventricosus TaxID=182803 RepID=A0A4Y2CFI4_ARAVE|nr:hypothetical protein AVEN_14568-1 [Araneus ventricosus]
MNALNIIDDAYVIRGEQSKMQFPSSQPVGSLKDESSHVRVYKVFPTTRKETKTSTFIIPRGMYQQAKDLFTEFKLIALRLTANSRVGLHVPQNILVTFGEKLRDLLGFVQRTFVQGDYISEYTLELRSGITEIYVYCDIVSASLVGDSSASVLKIIPVAKEHNEQIVKYFSVPLYFRVQKQSFDVIEIEMRTSSRTPIKFISEILSKRGHRLQPDDCIAYYQNQIGNADPYVSSNFTIQRGYAFFSNLRRYSLHLMMQAGKYLGKRFLTSSRNIVEDVSQGKLFRDAAIGQMRQSGREITTNILRKLRGGATPKAVKRKKINSKAADEVKEIKFTRRLYHSLAKKNGAALLYEERIRSFRSRKNQLAIDRSSFVEIHPIASITNSNTIEFLITGLGDAYFDFERSSKDSESSWHSFHTDRPLRTDQLSFEYIVFPSVTSHSMIEKFLPRVIMLIKRIFKALCFIQNLRKRFFLRAGLFYRRRI